MRARRNDDASRDERPAERPATVARRFGRKTVIVVVAVVLGFGGVVDISSPDPADAAISVVADFGSVSCGGSWNSVTAPPGTIGATFTVWGAGGASGDSVTGSAGGAGGRGAVVTGSLGTVAPGTTLWARFGCGGNANGSGGAGYTPGGNGGNSRSGGGGGSTALRLGSDLIAIAGGGGGGGSAAGVLLGNNPGGAGGDGNVGAPSTGGAAGQNEGNGRGGGRGGNGAGSPGSNGGAGGGGLGQGPGQNPAFQVPNGTGGPGGTSNFGNGAAGQNGPAHPQAPPQTPVGGGGGNGSGGQNNVSGGGGGGGLAGGGGGGGGRFTTGFLGAPTNWDGGSGGGSGSSWVRSTVGSPNVNNHAGNRSSSCSPGAVGSNPGAGGDSSANHGCAGNVQIVWTVAGTAQSFTTQPSDGAVNVPLAVQPVVTVTAPVGAIANDVVALNITPGTGAPGAVLTCATNPVSTNGAGQAIFTGCSIDKPGNGYTLTATNVTQVHQSVTATSAPFNVGYDAAPAIPCGTWDTTTVPPGLIEANVTVVGGGGGSGAATSGALVSSTSGSGGGGAVVNTPLTGLSEGQSVAFTTGCGGGAGTIAGSGFGDGGIGGTSLFGAGGRGGTDGGSNDRKGGGGGGASAVCIGNDACVNPLVVAGGGGAGGASYRGGATVTTTFGGDGGNAAAANNPNGGAGASGEGSADNGAGGGGATPASVGSGGGNGAAGSATTGGTGGSSSTTLFTDVGGAGGGGGYRGGGGGGSGNTTLGNGTVGAGGGGAGSSFVNGAFAASSSFAPVTGKTNGCGASINPCAAVTGGHGGAPVTASGGVFSGDSQPGRTGSAGTVSIVWKVGATHLSVAAPPSPTGAGDTFGFSATLKDYQGNTVVNDSIGTPSVTLNAPPSCGPLTQTGSHTYNPATGVITFSGLAIENACAGYTLSVSVFDTTTNLTLEGTSGSFTITPDDPAALEWVTQPPSLPTEAGEDFSVTVKVVDQFGNTANTVAPSCGGTAAACGLTDLVDITIANNPGGGTLAGDTPTNAVNGVANFNNLSIDAAGVGYTLHATNLTRSMAVIESDPFDVVGSEPAQLAFTVQPTSPTGAGSGFTVEVEVQDSGGNVVADNTDAITVSILGNPGLGTLSGTTTVNAVDGVATFTGLSIDKAGAGYTLAAQHVDDPGTVNGDVSDPFDITPAAPHELVYTVQPPSPIGAGDGFGVTVKIVDEFGNVADTVAASCGGSASACGLDHQVSLTIGSGPGSTLGGTTTVSAVDGVATFSGLTITTAGEDYTLDASNLTDGGVAGATSNTFDVTPDVPDHLAFSVQPPAVTGAGDLFSVSVQVRDQFGNRADTVAASCGGSAAACGLDHEITLALGANPGGDPLAPMTVQAVEGLAYFNGGLNLTQVGSGYTFTAVNETDSGITGATSDPFDVTPAVPAQLVFTGQPPAEVGAGAGFGATVAVQDQFGNPSNQVAASCGGTAEACGLTHEITVALGGDPVGGTLGGSTTEQASGGVATFSGLSVEQAGTGYQLLASNDTDASVTGATSAVFDVTPAAPAQLAFTTQPASPTAAGLTFAVVVEVQDEFGNRANTVAASCGGSATACGLDHEIAIDFGTNPSGATLGGTTTVAANAGQAVFSDLWIDLTGFGYTLVASNLTDGVVDPAESDPFNVTVFVDEGSELTNIADDGPGAGVASVAYFFCVGYGGACTDADWTAIGASTDEGSDWSVTWTGLPADGAYRVVAVGTDNVGNVSGPGDPTPVTVGN